MNFLLKIVEGPNRGAEIALVEGVAVTLGKGDECDIVLADSTLPDEPLSIEATGDAVTVNGEQLEQFAVKTLGATSFAVGPADTPWGELKWNRESGNGERGTGNLGTGNGRMKMRLATRAPHQRRKSFLSPIRRNTATLAALSLSCCLSCCLAFLRGSSAQLCVLMRRRRLRRCIWVAGLMAWVQARGP